MAKSIIEQLFSNIPLLCAFVAWSLAQFLKVPLFWLLERKLSIWRMFGSGGMPSSHSASTLALAISTGLSCGFDSPLFAIAMVLTSVVMYDAAGVRRAAGKQASVLNDIIELLSEHKEVPDEKLKELIGHTPVEVIGGAIIGFAVALIIR